MIRLTPWQRLIAAVAAALGAFALGMFLRAPLASGDQSDEVVAAVVHPAMPVASASGQQFAGGPSERLVAKVEFDPFGPLGTGTPATLGQPRPLAPAPRQPKRPEPPQPPAPPPTAPPLPFVAMGSLSGPDVTGGKPVAFLQQQGQLLVVQAGQSIGSTYRVEAITPQKIELIYLPLMQRQSLPLAP